MSQRIIKIFLGSPSDVNAEREAVDKVIKEINKSDPKVMLKLTSSDTLYPSHGQDNEGGQDVVFKQTGSMTNFDLFVGIMWKSIGSPTKGGYVSGTVEEYERAWKSLQEEDQPDIWFYFRDVEDEKQENELKEFKKKIKAKAFYKKYSDIEGFKQQFYMDIKSWKEKPENNTLLNMTREERTSIIRTIINEIKIKNLVLLKTKLLFENTKQLTDDKKNKLNDAIQGLKQRLETILRDNSNNQELSEKIGEHLCDLLKDKQHLQPKEGNYAAGNILNLLIKLGYKTNFSYFDLSHISIWEADLEQATLTGVDFSNSDLKNSSFSEPLGCIHSIAFNADGSYFATGDAHGLIRVYNTESLETRIFKNERKNQIWSVAFGLKKENEENEKKPLQMLAWGAEDGSVKVLSINNNVDHSSSNNDTSTNIYESNEGRRILSVAFSPKGNIFAIGGDGEKAIKLVKINKNNNQKESLDTTDVSCITFIDENYIACGSLNGNISLLSVNPQSAKLNIKKQVHQGVVRCIAFNKDKSILASGGEDGTVKMFRISHLEEEKPHLEEERVDFDLQQTISQVRTIAFSEDGNILAIGYIDNESSKQQSNKSSREQSEHKILLLEFKEEKWSYLEILDNSNNDGHQHLIRSLAFCPNPKKPELLISGGDGRTVKLWDIYTKECKHTLSGYANRIWSVAFSRDGKTFACGGEDNKIRIWNYDDRTHIPTQILPEHTDWVWSVAFSPKGDILASGTEDNKIFLWQLKEQQSKEQKWEYIRELTGHNKRVRCVAFNPNGDKLASAGNDNQVFLWDISNVDNPKPSSNKISHKDRVLSLAFSPDGKYLASSSRDKTICLIDAHTEKVQNRNLGANDQDHHRDQVHSIAFSPNSDLLVSGGFDQQLKLWQVPSGDCILSWEGDQKILSVAFHPTKPIVASAGANHFITLWYISQEENGTLKALELKRLKGHKRTVESIAFTPDGKKLISCSQDQTIQFWQIDGDINISIHTIELGKPYQGMNIFGVKNLEAHQISALEELGASRNV